MFLSFRDIAKLINTRMYMESLQPREKVNALPPQLSVKVIWHVCLARCADGRNLFAMTYKRA